MKSIYEQAIELAYMAGDAILEIYLSTDFEVALKSDESPLTRADTAAHLIIEKGLKNAGFPLLSEEGRAIPFSTRSSWKEFWLVDPLDGTKEFIKKNGEFTVNIAFIREGKPVFGVVYAPVIGTLYSGGEDVLPFKETVKGTRELLTRSFIQKEKSLRVVASSSHMSDETATYISELGETQLISMGSSLKFMLIADDKADIYPRFAPTMEWDTAAAHAILTGMGISVLNRNTMQELSYNKENLLNPHFIVHA